MSSYLVGGGDPLRLRWRQREQDEEELQRMWTIDPSTAVQGSSYASAHTKKKHVGLDQPSSTRNCTYHL